MPFSWYIFPQRTGVRGSTPLYNFSCSGDNGGGGSEGGKGMGIYAETSPVIESKQSSKNLRKSIVSTERHRLLNNNPLLRGARSSIKKEVEDEAYSTSRSICG